jgi:hypothetical protein
MKTTKETIAITFENGDTISLSIPQLEYCMQEYAKQVAESVRNECIDALRSIDLSQFIK